MNAVCALPTRRTRPADFTPADLAAMPDDGRRYELVDGVLVVSPSPSRPHQRASMRLSVILDRHAPVELEVLAAPCDLLLGPDTVVQPDLLIVPAEDDDALPVLVVEILSESTRRFDLALKRARYETAGIGAYWVIDPGSTPSIVAWELRDGAYVEVARAEGADTARLRHPFPIQVTPADLTGPRR